MVRFKHGEQVHKIKANGEVVFSGYFIGVCLRRNGEAWCIGETDYGAIFLGPVETFKYPQEVKLPHMTVSLLDHPGRRNDGKEWKDPPGMKGFSYGTKEYASSNEKE